MCSPQALRNSAHALDACSAARTPPPPLQTLFHPSAAGAPQGIQMFPEELAKGERTPPCPQTWLATGLHSGASWLGRPACRRRRPAASEPSLWLPPPPTRPLHQSLPAPHLTLAGPRWHPPQHTPRHRARHPVPRQHDRVRPSVLRQHDQTPAAAAAAGVGRRRCPGRACCPSRSVSRRRCEGRAAVHPSLAPPLPAGPW
mmetsp:Transcript_13202/g.39986  ORF Transcript_13202/g.39986 Transcript_13202/m.39986 type:complete len:200 (-) Transcript_13202:1546-2145(-)